MPDRAAQAIPADVRALADARALARAGRDWGEADRLRGEIEAAGWKVVDRGFSYALEAAHPPDLADGAVIRYGRSASVPSRLTEPPTGPATIVLAACGQPADLARTLEALRRHAPPATQVVVVADDPSAEQESVLGALGGWTAQGYPSIEVVRTSARLGPVAGLAIGIRAASGAIVISLDTSLEPTGDFVTPLIDALADPTIAVAGHRGLETGDLQRFTEAPGGDVDAIDHGCLAFRREDAAVRGPLDERFHLADRLAIWWSLVLRDEGAGVPPRRAVALADLPLVRHGDASADRSDGERDRRDRRDRYRILDRFGDRTDLLRALPGERPPVEA